MANIFTPKVKHCDSEHPHGLFGRAPQVLIDSRKDHLKILRRTRYNLEQPKNLSEGQIKLWRFKQEEIDRQSDCKFLEQGKGTTLTKYDRLIDMEKQRIQELTYKQKGQELLSKSKKLVGEKASELGREP